MREFRKYTANQLLEEIRKPEESRRDKMLKRFEFAAAKNQRNSEFQVWTHENHPVKLHTNQFFDQKMSYIHKNPIRAGIVSEPEDFLFSSARNYAGLDYELEIDFI